MTIWSVVSEIKKLFHKNVSKINREPYIVDLDDDYKLVVIKKTLIGNAIVSNPKTKYNLCETCLMKNHEGNFSSNTFTCNHLNELK